MKKSYTRSSPKKYPALAKKKKTAITFLMARLCSLMYDPAFYRIFKQHFQNTELKLYSVRWHECPGLKFIHFVFSQVILKSNSTGHMQP